MNEDDARVYVKAAASALGLALDAAGVRRVAAHFARTSAMAALLESADLRAEHEPAEIYRPAPFPAEDAP